MKTKRKILSISLLICLLICCGCGKSDSIYAEKENWAYLGVGEEKKADLFIVCPTVDMGAEGNFNMSLEDEATKANFLGALNMEKGIYENDTRMYAPYYRQVSFPVYSLSYTEAEQCFAIAYADVREAFLYYMEHYNDDRPVVLAGFSQGSDMILRLMKDLFDDPDINEHLVAAYCIGWRVTDEELKEFPQLKMAQGEDDTGVIVSFNTEAAGIDESLIIPKGVKTNGINPLNWKTDSTPADCSLNLGACFTDYSGEIQSERNQFTGAYLDAERGSLIVTDVIPSDYSNSLFPDGVYHLYDYQFFYRNLQQNVGVRVNAFCDGEQ